MPFLSHIGIDIDWEYPNSSGAGQPHSGSDSANLLLFFQSLRSKLGPNKIISAAVTHLPWLGPNGSPLTNVSAYAKEMNYVNIMYFHPPTNSYKGTLSDIFCGRNYDVNGASSSPGANAPLSDACGNSSQPTATAKAAFKQWTAAGFPAAKLLLGLPLYGYVCKSSKTSLSGSYEVPAGQTAMEVDDATKTSDEGHPRVRDRKGIVDVAAATGDLSSWYGQQIPFNSLLASGALHKKADGTYTGANGYTMSRFLSLLPHFLRFRRCSLMTFCINNRMG
jgi:chitinase